MISYSQDTYNGRARVEIYGLSTDTKPTDNIANGSVFFEIDTGKNYRFDREGGEWYPFEAGGGGSAILYDTTGQATDGAMTQKAVTDALPEVITISGNSVDADTLAKLVVDPGKYRIANNNYMLPFVRDFNGSLYYAGIYQPGYGSSGITNVSINKSSGAITYTVDQIAVKAGVDSSAAYDVLLASILADMALATPAGVIAGALPYGYSRGVANLTEHPTYLCCPINFSGRVGAVVEYINTGDGSRIVVYQSTSNASRYIVYPAYADGNEVSY